MKTKFFLSTILLTLLLAACGAQPTGSEPTPDVAAVRTSAASTVVAQFTLTAAVFTPTIPPPIDSTTDTPAAQETAVATATHEPGLQVTNESGTSIALCDALAFDVATVDVNVPDNTVMSPGQDFIKTWRVKNVGSCAWGAGYVLVFTGTGDDMDGQFIAMTEVIQPGQEVELSVQFKAPATAGIYVSTWQMQNAQDVPFPQAIYVKIIVQ
jgi:hypothetical protein